MNPYTPEQYDNMATNVRDCAWPADVKEYMVLIEPMLREAGATLRQQAERVDERTVSERIINWLRRNANACKEPVERATFIEAHNAAKHIRRQAALAQNTQGEAIGYMTQEMVELLKHKGVSSVSVHRESCKVRNVPVYLHAERTGGEVGAVAGEPRGNYLALITANQAQNLLDYFGGASTTYALIRCAEGECADEPAPDGSMSPSPAGLYIYDTNCPEEGVIYLGDEDEDSKPRDDSHPPAQQSGVAVSDGLRSLFLRVRPDVEVAPWVYREIEAMLAARPSQPTDAQDGEVRS